jgi:hypothetical protein
MLSANPTTSGFIASIPFRFCTTRIVDSGLKTPGPVRLYSLGYTDTSPLPPVVMLIGAASLCRLLVGKQSQVDVDAFNLDDNAAAVDVCGNRDPEVLDAGSGQVAGRR